MGLGSTSIVANILIRAQNLTTREFNAVSEQMAAVQAQSAGMGRTLGAATAGISSFMLRVGLAGGIIGAFSADTAAKFQAALAHVRAFAMNGSDSIQTLSKTALELGPKFGLSATEIVKASYDVFSAGIHGKEGLDLIKAASMGAAASGAPLRDVMRAVVTNIKDFGLAGTTVHDRVGQMAKTVQLGRMTWEEYSKALSTVEPIASALHIPFTELSALLVELTRHGNTANESTMMLRNSIQLINNPSQTARRALAALHVDVATLQQNSAQLIPVMVALKEASEHHAKSLQDVEKWTGLTGNRAQMLFEILKEGHGNLRQITGSTLAWSTILQTVARERGPELIGVLKEIERGGKSMDEALKVASQTAVYHLHQLKGAVEVAAIAIGNALLPGIVAVADALTRVLIPMAAFIQHHQAIAVILIGTSMAMLALGAAIKTVGFIVHTYTQGVELLTAALRTLGIIDSVEKSTQALGRTQGLATRDADMLAAAQTRLRAQTMLEQDAEKLSVQQKQRLIAQIDELDAAMAKQAQESGRVTVAEQERARAMGEVVKSTGALVNAERADADAMARLFPLQKEQADLFSRQTVLINAQRDAEERLKVERSAQMSALRAMGVAQAEYAKGLISVDELTQRVTVADEQRAAAARQVRTAQQDLMRVSTEAAAVDSKLAKTEGEIAAAEGERARSSGALLRVQDEQAAAAGRAALANGELAASEEGASTASKGLVAATGEVIVSLTGVEAAAMAVAVPLVGITLPLWAIVAAAAVLVIGLKLLYDHCEGFRSAVNGLMEALQRLADAALSKIMAALQQLGNFIDAVVSKFNDINDATDGWAGRLLMLTNPITTVVLLVQTLFEHLNLVTDAFKWAGEQAGKFFDALYKGDTVVRKVVDGVHALGDMLGHLGSAMDDNAEKEQHATDGGKAHLHVLQQQAQAASKLPDVYNKAAAAFQKMQQQVKAVDDSMIREANSLWAQYREQGESQVNLMAKHIIASIDAIRSHFLATIASMRHEAAVPIQVAPLIAPTATAAQRVGAAPAMDTASSTHTMEVASGSLQKVADQLAKLPPEFKSVGEAIAKGFQSQIDDAHKKFLAGLKLENQRHADAINRINATFVQSQHNEYVRASATLHNENQRYLDRLKMIQDDYAAKIQQYLATQSIRLQTAGQNFSAIMSSLSARLDQIQMNRNAALRALHDHFIQQMNQWAGKWHADQKRHALEVYQREVAAINHRFDMERANVDREIQRVSGAFREFNDRQQQQIAEWIRGSQATFDRHVAHLDKVHREAAERIRKAYMDRERAIAQQHAAQLAAEEARHRAHVAALVAAFNTHVEKIKGAMAKVAAPAGLWDAVKKQADDLAQNALKKLALAFLEHAKNINQVAKEALKDSEASIRMQQAMDKATAKLAELQSKSHDAATAMAGIANKAKSDMDKATAVVTKAMYDHKNLTAAQIAQVTRAITEQNRLTDAQDRAKQKLDELGLVVKKGKKTIDEWIQALSDATKKTKEAWDAAVAKFMLGTAGAASSLAALTGAADKYAHQEEASARRQQIVDDTLARAQMNAALRAGDLSRAFDVAAKTAKDQLTRAEQQAAMEIVKFGHVLPMTQAALDAARKSVDQFDKAMQQVQDQTLSTAKSFKQLAQALADKATVAMDQFADATIRAAQGDLEARRSLDGLRQAAVDAAMKSDQMAEAEAALTRQIKEQELALRGDYNSMLEHARMLAEDALAAYENAVAQGVTGAALELLKEKAVGAAVALRQIEDVAKEISDAAAELLGDNAPGDTQPTQLQEDRLALSQQHEAFTESLDTQKLSLQQQKLAEKTQNDQFKQSQATARQQGTTLESINAKLQETVNYQSQMISVLQRALYYDRLGLSRNAVGGDWTAWWNGWGGQSAANPSVMR